MSNYIDDLLKLHYKQTDKGYGKYGKPLEQHDAEILERLQHLQEELMDALHYTFWIAEKIRNARENGYMVEVEHDEKVINKNLEIANKEVTKFCIDCGHSKKLTKATCFCELGLSCENKDLWVPKKEDTNV